MHTNASSSCSSPDQAVGQLFATDKNSFVTMFVQKKEEKRRIGGVPAVEIEKKAPPTKYYL